jgi:hypothetical protein
MRHSIRHASLALLVACAAPGAHALDAAGAKQVVDKFLASQSQPQATADAVQHVVADLDGDGRPDIVLMWNVLGPTYFFPKLTVFLDQGRSYRTLTADLSGQTERLTVKGPDILVDTLMLGPNDPRCCPTLKARMHFRWQGGKLVMFR